MGGPRSPAWPNAGRSARRGRATPGLEPARAPAPDALRVPPPSPLRQLPRQATASTLVHPSGHATLRWPSAGGFQATDW